jgi:anti-sigma factor RsiW
MHLDAEQLQRLLDRELRPPDEAAMREHLAHCADCRRRVAEAEQADAELQAQLRLLDHDLPLIGAAEVAARGRERAPGFRRLRWVAGIFLALGLAGAAYAAPGSPVGGWVRAALAWVSGDPNGTPRQAPGPEPRAGIAVAPGQDLIISFASRPLRAEVQVILIDGQDVVVRAPMGSATFTSDVERLVIHPAGDVAGAVFEIEIPRAAPRVEIQVQGERRFVKQGPVISGPYRFAL